MSSPTENMSIARKYIRTIEEGNAEQALAEFCAPEYTVEYFPNRIYDKGAKTGIDEARESAIRAKSVMTSQRFDILNEMANRDMVAMEIEWTGTLAQPLGSLPAGGAMRARFATFIKLRDNKIIEQRNYYCYDPW